MPVKPSVSVVITCYNYGRFLDNCIKCVLSQSYSPHEIIVVDDGSTDNTADVMEAFKQIQNIRYIYQNNAGQARAKNVGIHSTIGEFVAFLDADDLWCHEKLERQMDLFVNKNVGVVYCISRYIDEKGEDLDGFKLAGKYLKPRAGRVTDYLIFDNFVPFSSTVVRRESLCNFGAFDESLKMGIDWDLWLKISTAYEFSFVDEPLLLYRMGHVGQMSKNLEERQRCSDRIMSQFLEKYPDVVSNRLINQAMAYTHCGRGYYFSKVDKNKSNAHYWQALKNNPLEILGYKGLIKNMLY